MRITMLQRMPCPLEEKQHCVCVCVPGCILKFDFDESFRISESSRILGT